MLKSRKTQLECSNNIKKDKYFILSIVVIYFVLIIMYIVVLLTDNIAGYNGIIMTIGTIIVVALIIKICISIKNSLLIKKNDTNEIYIRDIPSKYTPAIVSYLYNQKIEKKKDIIATILNLCSKNVISFKKDENNNIMFVDLNNSAVNLSSDEIYIYNWITKKSQQNFSFIDWNKIVKEEYNKYNFSKKSNRIFEKTLAYAFIFAFTLIFTTLVISAVLEFDIFKQLNIQQYIMPFMIIAFALTICGVLFDGIKSIFMKNMDGNNIYTAKGANEIAKWEKFKKYMNDFSLIKDAKIDSVVILERYLAYSMVLNINKNYDEANFYEINELLKLDFKKSIDDYVDNVFSE